MRVVLPSVWIRSLHTNEVLAAYLRNYRKVTTITVDASITRISWYELFTYIGTGYRQTYVRTSTYLYDTFLCHSTYRRGTKTAT
jgi:hypothetical protein